MFALKQEPRQSPDSIFVTGYHNASGNAFLLGHQKDGIYIYSKDLELTQSIRNAYVERPTGIVYYNNHYYVGLREGAIIQMNSQFFPRHRYQDIGKGNNYGEFRQIHADSEKFYITTSKGFIVTDTKFKLLQASTSIGSVIASFFDKYHRLFMLTESCDLLVYSTHLSNSAGSMYRRRLPLQFRQCASMIIDGFCLLLIGTKDGQVHMLG
ncbi:hypothetical protein ACOME3_003636 [Neoechinorhynchus agilis]